MKDEKKENVLHQRLTLAEARKRIEEFKNLKKIEGKSGGAAVPPSHSTKGSAPKEKG